MIGKFVSTSPREQISICLAKFLMISSSKLILLTQIQNCWEFVNPSIRALLIFFLKKHGWYGGVNPLDLLFWALQWNNAIRAHNAAHKHKKKRDFPRGAHWTWEEYWRHRNWRDAAAAGKYWRRKRDPELIVDLREYRERCSLQLYVSLSLNRARGCRASGENEVSCATVRARARFWNHAMSCRNAGLRILVGRVSEDFTCRDQADKARFLPLTVRFSVFQESSSFKERRSIYELWVLILLASSSMW